MVIQKVKSEELKGNQQIKMVDDCRDDWLELNDSNLSHYHDIMNMITYRWNNVHYCHVAITYHFKSNKW